MNGLSELTELHHAVARGAYLIDPVAVADAMLSRGDAAIPDGDPASDGDSRRSPVLVPGELQRPTTTVEQTSTLTFLDAS